MFILLIILKILLYLLIFIVGLFLLLLLVPINYSGQVLTADGLRVQLALGWAWNLLSDESLYSLMQSSHISNPDIVVFGLS